MSTQLKHAGDPAATDNKPGDRRRGAAGRAAALRRAPSDSDCSGETASLSADSGERRPPPPPPRSGKTRSRRRGSEWEVLEGLKDGQRFERRPEVFNGFLHKKRKWPLKGWHKRFFVVDGGILVYARSPTDVARGRLHGSLDVGLSVISAKPRRRRIDIDADEFIYHLRAKTPDVFRTWLNVLKAHRLYRQHLLTFGARESVPKIHAPLDDLPPTDTSSRVSQSSIESFSSLTQSQSENPKSSFQFPSSEITSSVYDNKSQCSVIKRWKGNQSSSLIPFEASNFSNSKPFDVPETHNMRGSLCSMHCVVKKPSNLHNSYKALPDIPLCDEKQMISTDLDFVTLQSNSLGSDSIYESIVNNFNVKTMTGPTKSTPKPAERMLNESVTTYNDVNGNSPLWRDNKEHAVYCFSQKHRHRSRSRRRGDQWTMKRSRKCTNLVKYKNMTDEPRLAKPLLRQMILCKYRLNVGTRNLEDACVWCDFTKEDKVDKSTQDSVSLSEYDRISEKLIFNLFDTPEDNVIKSAKARRSSLYVNQVVKELYDLNISESKKHPIKFLFKSLLQYFLKNTQGKFRGSILRDVATNRPSNTYFSRDKEVSFPNFKESTESRTQSTQDTQFIEEFIKSNIYYSSTGRGSSVETDIKITRTLIDNLDTSSTKFVKEGIQDKVTDSSELSKLQEFIKHLVSETSLSKAVAKDFLNAYLCVLGCGSKSISSLESSPSLVGTNGDPICDIQTECVQKKISKSISVNDGKSSFKVDIVNSADQGKLDFKVITDGFNNGVNNMMGLFTNKVGVVNNEQDINDNSDNTVSDNKSPAKTELKSEGLKSTKTLEALEHEMLEEDYNSNIPNTIVIDLSSYDVKNVLMSKDDTVVDTTLLAIDLKDKSDSDDSKLKRLSLKFNNANPTPTEAPNAINTAKNKTNPIYQVHMRSNNPFLGKNWKKNDEFEIEKLFTALKASKENCSDQSFNRSLNTTRCSRSSCSNKDSDQCDFLSSIQEGMSYPNKKNNLTNFIPGFFTPQTWKQKKTEPEIVGLDFFFRVLKKLVALSKDIPSIHKEINILYWKLKTTHETAANGHSRANVLGDIYGININRESLSSEVPMDLSMYPDINQNIRNKAVEIAINTSFIYPKLHNGLDKALSAGVFGEMLTNISVQTLSIDIGADRANAIDNFANIYAYKVEEKKKTYSKDEWLRSITEEYVKTDAIKCMLKKYHHLPQSIRVTHPIKAKAKIPDVTAPPNSSLMIEFSSISPPLTISNRSQNSMKADVYELFKRTKSKLIRSESMTMSSLFNAKSDVSNDLKTLYRCSSEPSYCSGLISPNAGTIRGPQAGFVSGTPGGRLAGWIVESGGPLESASRELGQAQLSVQQLQRLLDAMLELQHQLHHDTDVSLEGASPNVKKDRRKFGLRKKKSNSKCASVELAPPHMDPSSSHMALSALTAPPSPGGGSSSMPNSAASLPMACAAARPQSLPGAEALGVGPSGGPTSLTSLTPDHQLREDFTILAKDLVANLKTVVSTLVVERGRLRAAMESAEVPPAGGVVAALRTNLTSALQQNSELRTRLSRIHDASDLAEISSVGNNSDQQVTRPFPQSLSYSSSCVSASEFFDAEEHEDELKPAEIIATDEAGVIELDGDSSSEAGSLSSEEGSASSDNSDGATSAVIPAERTPLQNGSETICSRRLRLPCPRPTPASPSLWNLLYKNIGKDLSQISMPVTINEPLNMLQRLCEELEYSSLLDSAASCTNELERMSLVAAFAVSAYAASAHRAASKPFNPLLAETYECIRDDRDFRFLAEQVSHHPPISACHAESPRWTFWQEARIKTKFWGKSMEFQPTGRVHVRLSPSGDHYSWNKVTTCVHNLFGGQRWVDQYGDMHIACHGTEITCKLQFIKASSWSSSRHEVRGVVAVGGAPRMRLQGRWSDGLQAGDRTLWRPGAMPADYELYYGFTRFAMELNELEPGMRDILPSTDTRLRPDQRALEEGDVDAAEQFKHELEQAQRERRRDGVEHTARWFRKTIEEGEETWVFTGEYWKAREAGFIDTPRLW